LKKLISIGITIIIILFAKPFHHVDNKIMLTNKLIYAIIKTESNYNVKAISKKKAMGLMQIRYAVWGKALRKEGIIKNKNDLFNPEKNVKAGTFILAHYLKKHNNDLKKALHSYSGGAKNYHSKIMKHLNAQ
jgi:soluble lytic murein transglycosylase